MTIDVTTGPRGSKYPLRLIYADEVLALLTESDARFLVADLQRALEDLEGPFVQVKFLSGGGSKSTAFTYRDPSGTLQVGDLVEVPSRFGTGIAKVSALGKGSFKGEILEVTAKLSKEVLAA